MLSLLIVVGAIRHPANQKRFWRDPEQAALIGARIGPLDTRQLSTPRINSPGDEIRSC
jgi:hypothetical protein